MSFTSVMRITPRLPLGMILTLLAFACAPAAPQPSAPAGAGSRAQVEPFNPATYQGPDRQQKLEEQAKKEGELVIATSGSLLHAVRGTKVPEPAVEIFQKKYPFIKANVYSADSTEVVQKIIEENRAGRLTMDLVEFSGGVETLKKLGLLADFYSPHKQYYPPEAMDPEKMMVPVRQVWLGLGYNTNLLSAAEAPKTYRDLADPKWKGKMLINSGATGRRWVGAMLQSEGEAFLRRLGSQGIRSTQASPRAMLDQVAGGEFPLSPTIFHAHVLQSKAKTAPLEWIGLEPVVANVGMASLLRRAPHPAAGMLFLDYLLSEEGQEYYMDRGYPTARTDVKLDIPYNPQKKFIPELVTSDYAQAEKEWGQLFRQVFLSGS